MWFPFLNWLVEITAEHHRRIAGISPNAVWDLGTRGKLQQSCTPIAKRPIADVAGRRRLSCEEFATATDDRYRRRTGAHIRRRRVRRARRDHVRQARQRGLDQAAGLTTDDRAQRLCDYRSRPCRRRHVCQVPPARRLTRGAPAGKFRPGKDMGAYDLATVCQCPERWHASPQPPSFPRSSTA